MRRGASGVFWNGEHHLTGPRRASKNVEIVEDISKIIEEIMEIFSGNQRVIIEEIENHRVP
jgi:hypothetical protein